MIYSEYIRTCSANQLYGPDAFPERSHCRARQKFVLVSPKNNGLSSELIQSKHWITFLWLSTLHLEIEKVVKL